MNTLDVLQQALTGPCGLDPARPVLAGVSGGADSTCLLHGLARLGWHVTAAHFDHQLREDSSQDAAAVERMALGLGVGYIGGGADVRALALREGLSIEEAARAARYRFLFAQARQRGAQAVLVGHTADDQVETVLMHLLRGSGLSGLRGMDYRSLHEGWDGVIPLARPLLGLGRADTETYCAANGLDPLRDPSNADTIYFRNRLRHELIPYLETYNPQIRQVLLRTADVLRGEYDLVEAAVGQAWQTCQGQRGAGYVRLELGALHQLEVGLLRGLLRRALSELRPGLRDISFQDVERAASFVHAPSRSGEMDLTAGLRLFIEEGWLYLEVPGAAPLPPGWPQLARPGVYELDAPGALELAGGWRLRAERAEASLVDVHAARPNEIWLDARGLELPLRVRAARPGERFAPLGMGGHTQKLSDLFINAGTAKRARARWPLVCEGEQALWVVGLRVGHSRQVREGARELLHIVLEL